MKNNLLKKSFIMISLFAIIVSFSSFFSNSTSQADAFGVCEKVGSFMGQKSVSGDSSSPNATDPNRKWTVEELFRNSIGYSSFYGEGKGTWLYAEKVNRGEHVAGWTGDVQTKIESARGFSCITGGFDFVPQIFLILTGEITSLTSSVVISLVGQDKIADVIGKIVGGGDNDGGLISTFLNSFYMPLVVLAALIMTVTIVYKGLIKRQIREAFSSLIWSVGAFVVGVAFMLNPGMLASAPQAITSTITSCVVGSLSGQSCISGEVQTPTLLAGKECISSTATGNSAESVVNGLNCTIWKAFVLEPWAEEQFGAPYRELYTSDPPSGGSIWSNLPAGSETKYCVNTSSSQSLAEGLRGTPTMDSPGGEICNVALYHLFIKTDMIDTVSQSGNNYTDGVMKTDDTGSYDGRWYDIIVPMAQDSSKWRNWAGEDMLFSRIAASIMSLIAIIAAASVLLTLALFGGAYKLIGLILMAFAPIFLLMAIEPTRGKKIFLGWLETVVSSILKYFAITVLMVIALILYAGLLSNTNGILSLIGVIFLTVALHMYRKEIVDLIGASNMGGQRLSNKANELGSKAWKQVSEKSKAVAGGFIGGVMAENSSEHKERVRARKENLNELRQSLATASTDEEKSLISAEIGRQEEKLGEETGLARKGAFESGKRSLKRGTGLTANAFSQAGRTETQLEKGYEADKEAAEEFKSNLDSVVQPPSTDRELGENFENKVSQADEMQRQNSLSEEQNVESNKNVVISNLRDNVREPVELKGDLSEEEKNALHEFADKLKENVSDEDLAELANNPFVLDDENKRNLVANEINARIQANTMVGIASNALSRTILSDNSLISDEELKFNVQMHAENYLETGSEEELKNYLRAASDLSDRLDVEFDEEIASDKMKDFRDNFEGTYVRKSHIPTESELKGLDDYTIQISENEEFNSNSVSTPEEIQAAVMRNRELVSEYQNLNNEQISEDEKQSDNENEFNQEENIGPRTQEDSDLYTQTEAKSNESDSKSNEAAPNVKQSQVDLGTSIETPSNVEMPSLEEVQNESEDKQENRENLVNASSREQSATIENNSETEDPALTKDQSEQMSSQRENTLPDLNENNEPTVRQENIDSNVPSQEQIVESKSDSNVAPQQQRQEPTVDSKPEPIVNQQEQQRQEPVVESKPEPTVEPQQQQRQEPVVESKPEPTVEPQQQRQEPVVDSKPEPTVAPQQQQRQEPVVDSKPEPTVEPQQQQRQDPVVESKPEPTVEQQRQEKEEPTVEQSSNSIEEDVLEGMTSVDDLLREMTKRNDE